MSHCFKEIWSDNKFLSFKTFYFEYHYCSSKNVSSRPRVYSTCIFSSKTKSLACILCTVDFCRDTRVLTVATKWAILTFFFLHMFTAPPCFVFSRLCCTGMNPVQEILFHKPRPPGLSCHLKWCSSLEGHDGWCRGTNLYSDAFVACRQGQWKGNNYSLVFSEEEGKKLHIVFSDVIFKCHCSLACCWLFSCSPLGIPRFRWQDVCSLLSGTATIPAASSCTISLLDQLCSVLATLLSVVAD